MSLHPRLRSGLACPDDPQHGPLVPWVSERFGWHCPHHGHDDAGTVPFFTTPEAEAGVPVLRRRDGADTPAAELR